MIVSVLVILTCFDQIIVIMIVHVVTDEKNDMCYDLAVSKDSSLSFPELAFIKQASTKSAFFFQPRYILKRHILTAFIFSR